MMIETAAGRRFRAQKLARFIRQYAATGTMLKCTRSQSVCNSLRIGMMLMQHFIASLTNRMRELHIDDV